jgi:hypothetical protein
MDGSTHTGKKPYVYVKEMWESFLSFCSKMRNWERLQHMNFLANMRMKDGKRSCIMTKSVSFQKCKDSSTCINP